MTKKQIKERNKAHRVLNDMNMGTRTMKSSKDYKRKENKVDLRNIEY